MRAMRAEEFSGYKGLKLVDLPKPAVSAGKCTVTDNCRRGHAFRSYHPLCGELLILRESVIRHRQALANVHSGNMTEAFDYLQRSACKIAAVSLPEG